MTRASLYKQSDPPEDNRFIEQYAPLVKRIAHHLLARLPQTVQADDLIQAGMIGLIEAHRNFDDTKGASFTTYAGIRIRGSMLDEIRKGDWAPRSVHRNSRRVQEAMRTIEHNLGRDAKPQEVADLLGITVAEYHEILKDSNGTKIFAFEELGVNQEAFGNHATGHSGPLEGVQNKHFKVKLADEISKLPDREKLVLALYYDEELNLREVGEVLGVSESRISQIHSQAMHRLASRMKAWKPGEL